MTEENEIFLGLEAEGNIADLVLGKKERYVDPMSLNSVKLERKNEETFVGTVSAYCDPEEEISTKLTRQEVLNALGWDSI